MALRPYQTKAIEQIRAFFLAGKRKVLVHMATGSGKTVIFCEILKGVYQKGNHAVMVVKGRDLVDQASRRLDRENVPHGVLMGSHWRYRPHERIQVCSIDTLRSRMLTPKANIIVIDEAHLAVSDQYKQFLSRYPDALLLPVTATPYKKMGHIAEDFVRPISFVELCKQGYLVPPRYFTTKSKVKLDDIKIVNKEYHQGQLSDRMSEMKIMGDVVGEWKERGQGRPSLCFAVTIEHSHLIVQSFKEAGIEAEHCDADTSLDERQAIIQRLESGRTQIVSNVGIFCTGVDIPKLSCLILARPTRSYCLYVQQLGRGTRPAPGKKDFLVLDHGGNIFRHGFIENEPSPLLNEHEHENAEPLSTCAECLCVYRRLEKKCPECGSAERLGGGAGGGERDTTHYDGEMIELSPAEKLLAAMADRKLMEEVENDIRNYDQMAKTYGYKVGYTWAKIKEKYGNAIANFYLKDRFARRQ